MRVLNSFFLGQEKALGHDADRLRLCESVFNHRKNSVSGCVETTDRRNCVK